MSNPQPGADEELRDVAATWLARMHGPDAERARGAFEAWLAESADHRRVYDRMVLRWDQAALVGYTRAGLDRSGIPQRRRPRPALYLALAASIALVFGVATLLPRLISSSYPGSTAHSMSALASEVGIRRIRLSDGSLVTLDAGSRIVLRYAPAERRIELVQGRARFEVAHDSGRPFVVLAGDKDVVATGTVFDVRLNAGRVSVMLLRGGVEIRRVAAGPKRSPLATLSPGEAVEFGKGQSQPVVRAAPASDRAWPTGMIEFNGIRLREMIATANRYSKRQILLKDDVIGNLRVTAGYRMGDADALAAALAAGFELRVVRLADGNLVLTR